MTPSPADVLVNGQWTGPGTANPQAGEIAGANPGLAQLAQYMGMTTAQTAAWIQSSQAATQTAPPAIPTPVTAAAAAPAPSIAGQPWYVWAAGGLLAFFIFGRRK